MSRLTGEVVFLDKRGYLRHVYVTLQPWELDSTVFSDKREYLRYGYVSHLKEEAVFSEKELSTSGICHT